MRERYGKIDEGGFSTSYTNYIECRSAKAIHGVYVGMLIAFAKTLFPELSQLQSTSNQSSIT